MNNNILKKRIDTSRDERNLLGTSFIVLASGSATVLLQNSLLSKGWIGIIGIFFSIILFFLYLKKSIQIDDLINKLEDK